MDEFERIKGLEIRNWLPTEQQVALNSGADPEAVHEIVQQSAQRAIRGDRFALQDGQFLLGEIAVENS